VNRRRAAALAVAGFAAMEPAAAGTHRWVMHRGGWTWHRSHHRRPHPGLEANDLFPVLVGAMTAGSMVAGRLAPRLRPLLAIGAGVTAYGAAYLVVHDLLVHERLGAVPGRGARYVRWVADAHGRHHRSGGPPYGFLLPVGGGGRRDQLEAVDAVAVGLRRPISDRAATRSFVDVGTRARAAKTS
jgi:beta-carotene 3-hydroxylase